MALVKVAADKRHLISPDGYPFFALGVNYAGYFDRAWKMWEPALFDPVLIERDFRKARNSGFNTIRLFLHRPVLEQIRQGDFDRLDQTLSIAQDHQLLVLLTLNDAHDLNLSRVGELDAKIAARYKDVPTIFAYDLENEPVFYNLAAGIYPAGYDPPIQTSQLVDYYGLRVERDEAADLQNRGRIPGHLDADTAFYYINALRLFLEYDAAINRFVKQGQGTLVDFMVSGEATPWHPLITVLHETVDRWLRARIDPIHAAGSHQLLTVGWSWLHFAALPANHILDFQEYHNYTSLSRTGFYSNLDHLKALRRAFPSHPFIFGEFGWSNNSGTDQATSRPVHPALTGLYEAATYTYLRANGFAGGFKWMLNDVQNVNNPYEANFGLFSVGDQPKTIRDLVHRFSQDWPEISQDGHLAIVNDIGSGISYRFDGNQHTTIGGYIYQDESLSWHGEGITHCFIKVEDQALLIDAQGAGRLSIDPWDLIPAWNRARRTDLYRVYSEQHRTRQQIFEAGQSVEIDVRPGAQYLIAMGQETPVFPPPEGAPQVDPKPGEHVLLLVDFDNYLHAALNYIRRFAPDFTFAAAEVAGRWAYVTVIASPEQIPDEVLDTISGSGAQLVERVVGHSPDDTKTMLDEMAARGQRFLSAIAPAPPQEEPPTALAESVLPTNGTDETYIVQPGDTLSKIANHVYGDFRLWPLIFQANRDKLSDPSLIRVGLELHIPEPG